MYKTVRHGENSLQYTILPQDDGGTTCARQKRARRKGKTTAVLAVTVMLICGVVATAVLVPLLLTTDLVALPSAFQRFSVSSLHQAHSGNRVMLVAKKPYGWNNTHHINTSSKPVTGTTSTTTTTPTTTTTTTVSPPRVAVVTKDTDNVFVSSSLVTPGTTSSLFNLLLNTTTASKTTTEELLADNVKLHYYNRYTGIPPVNRNYIEVSTTTIASKASGTDGVIVFIDGGVQATSPPSWYQSISTYFQWMNYDINGSFLVPAVLVSLLLSICTIGGLLVIALRKVMKKRRQTFTDTNIENTTEDKATLLKETSAASEEE